MFRRDSGQTPPSGRCTASIGLAMAACTFAGCLSPQEARREADTVTADIISSKQMEALGHTEPLTIEPARETLRRRLQLEQDLPIQGEASIGTDALSPIDHWPKMGPSKPGPRDGEALPWIDSATGSEELILPLNDCLQVGARNSRDYQDRKEDVFRSALSLDLARDDFRFSAFGLIDTMFSTDLSGSDSVNAVVNTDSASFTKKLETGATLTGLILIDLVHLIRGDRSKALGVLADASISIPLLRGAGRHIVTEPLTQAEREVIYSIQSFERFKRTFAVRVATEYLSVLQQLDQVNNAEDNYRRLVFLARRSRRLADAGRLPEVQVDQAKQDELRARDRWIGSQQSLESRFDGLKRTLGLPVDAVFSLDRNELNLLLDRALETLGTSTFEESEGMPADAPIELQPPTLENAGPLETEDRIAIETAIENRQDLRTVAGRVYDAERRVVVAADALGPGAGLILSGQTGERRGISTADLRNAELRPTKGFYTADLDVDLPWERTAERNAYRNSLIDLERATRGVQELEDQIKLNVRDGLRSLKQARESFRIQERATVLAQRRVDSTNMLLDAGRAQIRDLLEAQEDLLSAQNNLTAALVNYRISELELQRDMGVLLVDETGLWQEYRPDEIQPSPNHPD